MNLEAGVNKGAWVMAASQEGDSGMWSGRTHSLVTWQSVLFWSEQSHLMAGLKAGLSSMDVSSIAAPVQGFPLMFHDGGALSPSLLRMAFTAAAGRTQENPQPFTPRALSNGIGMRTYLQPDQSAAAAAEPEPPPSEN